MQLKYVRHSKIGFVLWPKTDALWHSHVGDLLRRKDGGHIISAGFCSLAGAYPGIEEQYTDDGPVYYVATSTEAFNGADQVFAFRSKPGVCRVMTRFGNTMLTVYAKDEFVPAEHLPEAQAHCSDSGVEDFS